MFAVVECTSSGANYTSLVTSTDLRLLLQCFVGGAAAECLTADPKLGGLGLQAEPLLRGTDWWLDTDADRLQISDHDLTACAWMRQKSGWLSNKPDRWAEAEPQRDDGR